MKDVPKDRSLCRDTIQRSDIEGKAIQSVDNGSPCFNYNRFYYHHHKGQLSRHQKSAGPDSLKKFIQMTGGLYKQPRLEMPMEIPLGPLLFLALPSQNPKHFQEHKTGLLLLLQLHTIRSEGPKDDGRIASAA